ncbi:MAG: aminotransferase class I/II-fold pyridoxal phosphate-dependent enzyme [Gemmatimonadetes bacterium]|nr:aminotransferase class I/II-fold pyridoxal phosphate-dependent enzyme [Gemmatimonadota bacterium]
MPVSRRAFLASLGAGGAGVIALPLVQGRGREALYAFQSSTGRRADRMAASAPGVIRIDSNENPNGPGARVFEAMRGAFAEANRYPFKGEEALREAIAKTHGIKSENVLLSCGSGELLRITVQALTSKDRALVVASPTFESSQNYAKFLGTPVRAVPVDAKLRLDLQPMADAAKGAGLVYFCNPNNPTATVHGKAAVAQFIEQVSRTSPETTVLVDEAYHEYVDDPTYATAIPLAMQNPHVIVTRTMSKVFGMAGMRCGYAVGRPEALAKLSPWILDSGVNQLVLAGATVAVADKAHIADEQKKNREAKAFTRKFFEGAGYAVGVSEANFLMIDIRKDVKAFKADALRKGVAVGRQFPPLNTQLRLSVGTMAEMQRAVEILKPILA